MGSPTRKRQTKRPQSSGKSATKSPEKKDRDEIQFVTCTECGNEQAYMGKNVLCETCDARMPEPEGEA